MSETLAPPFDCNKAIQRLSDEAKLTQQEIASAIGLTQGRVSQFYSGTDKQGMRYESYYKLSKLCKKHKIKMDDDYD